MTCLYVGGISLFICLMIGLPCYFKGCESTIQPNCVSYNTNQVTFVSSTITQDLCCSYRKKGICVIYYTCYNGYVTGTYYNGGGDNRTCVMDVGSSYSNYEDALKQVSNFRLNTTESTLVDKVDGKCVLDSIARNLAIAGFTFLIMAGLVIIATIV